MAFGGGWTAYWWEKCLASTPKFSFKKEPRVWNQKTGAYVLELPGLTGLPWMGA